MSRDINEISFPLQKVIDMGEIDRWLRGISRIVPQPASPATPDADDETAGLAVSLNAFNRHIMTASTQGLVGDDDVEQMVGFRQLMNAASRNNVRVDIASPGHGALEVNFEPGEPFSASRVFGASYTNVIPALFGRAPGMGAKK